MTNVEKMRTARVNGSERRRPLLQRISQAASAPHCPTDTARNSHSLHAHTQPSANYNFSFSSNRPSSLDSLPAGSGLPTEKLSDFYSTFLEAGCPSCHLINSRKKKQKKIKKIHRDNDVRYEHHTTTVLHPFFWHHPVPKENFWTIWCKEKLTEADTLRPSG